MPSTLDVKDAEAKYIIFASKETEIFEWVQFSRTNNYGRSKQKWARVKQVKCYLSYSFIST